MATKINEKTEITIPLKNLIGLIVIAAIAVWAYVGVTERISFLEHRYVMDTDMMEMQLSRLEQQVRESKQIAEDAHHRIHQLSKGIEER